MFLARKKKEQKTFVVLGVHRSLIFLSRMWRHLWFSEQL